MPEGRCKNKDCNRLIFDTEKLDELPNQIECQHCHHVNILRQKGTWVFGVKKKKRKKVAPAPKVKAKEKTKPGKKVKAPPEPVEPAPSPEESAAAPPASQTETTSESLGPATEGTAEESE